MKALLLLCTVLFAAPFSAWGHSEAIEIGIDNTEDLPTGKEADGIIGDFVLRNHHVQALVSGNLPLRRANMSTFYGANGMTPGCLYDLTARGDGNDQITIFSPCEQRGPVSYVRIVPDQDAVVETVVTAASNGGLFKRHEYRLKEHAKGIHILTTLRNESTQVRTQALNDRWTTFVVATHEGMDLSTGYGTSDQSKLHPCAYNNPIFVDVNGGGFQANGDMLGYPLGVGNLSLEEAKKLLAR